MAENIFTNKWFVIALLVALLVMIYLYHSKSCGVEGMRNIDLTPLAHDISEKPWTDDQDDVPYKKVGNKFDKHADGKTRNRLPNKSRLKRKDEVMVIAKESGLDGSSHAKFVEYDLDDEDLNRPRRRRYDNYPKPLDSRPDLSQCQPCICPGDADDDFEERRRRRRSK